MGDRNDRLARFSAHHEALVEDVLDHRNAVLDPSREFDRQDYAEYLRETLLPHAAQEEEVLYSRVDELVDLEIATAGMRADHEEIERRIDALETLEPDGASLPLALHELTALVNHHFRKEESVLLSFLQENMDDAAFGSLLESILDDQEKE